MAYATSILRDHHLAEDAVQEAFVEAYRELPNLREPAAFAGWFRAIIFKHCDRITRRKRHPVTSLDAALEVASPAPSPEETLDMQETRASVWKAITTLSEAERAVVLLYYMGEHSHAVIAEFLNITANAVKTRLYAARKRLRKHMGQIEENLNAARPSNDPQFAEKVQRMIQPEALKKTERLFWSPGIGAEVWEMFCACIRGDLETVERLVGKDPSLVRCHYEYRTPLSFAARENQVEIAAYLLDHGAAPFGVGGDLIQVAQERGYIEMEQLLASKYAAMFGASAQRETIATAIRERDLAQVRRLLDDAPELLFQHGMNPNLPNWLRITPLHYFAESGDVENAAIFIEHGADLNAREEEFCSTPLGWAARCGKTHMVELLIQRGAKLNLPDDLPNLAWATPLQWATRRGHHETVRLLTEYEQTGELPVHSLEEYETLAQSLVEAYGSGNDAPMQRLHGLSTLSQDRVRIGCSLPRHLLSPRC